MNGHPCHRRWMPGLVFAVLVLPLTVVADDERGDLDWSRETPRPFGYVMGDVIPHQITLRMPEEFVLMEETLPDVGPVTDWLELRDREVEELIRRGHREYRISLEYQVFRASRDVRSVEVPALELAAGTGERAMQTTLPPWEFVISPLLETIGARTIDGRLYVRPEDAPLREDTRPQMARSAVWGGLLLLFGGWHAGRVLHRRMLSRAPFERAYRELLKLRKRDDEAAAVQEAMRTMHRAFDTTAGRPLFAEEVPRFVAENPELAPLTPDIEVFFADSRRMFFGAAETTRPHADLLRDLLTLGRACRQCERQA